MLFNSYGFIFGYVPIVFFLYFLFNRFRLTKIATGFLTVASLYFYAYWDIRYLPLLLLSVVINFALGRFIEIYRKRSLLVLGIVVNFGLLGYFKYTGFLIDTANYLFHGNFVIPEILLPLGISFFTFTQTAYLVDAYRGETKRYDFLTYSLFVTIFPHLIAGPILYHKDMIPQFSHLKNFVMNEHHIALGITYFSFGLFKKTVIADGIAPWANFVFSHVDSLSFLEAWIGAICYTLQLYFDFSGYSEMAIGLGFLFNFRLPINFDSPYKSLSFIELWRRWHITLSTYLKNYLYIPLGGNRHGKVRQMLNVFITFLLGGVWHGAGWTFVVWGAMNGIFVVINHLWKQFGRQLPSFLSWSLTFFSWVATLVVFRAHSIHDAEAIFRKMFNFGFIFSEKNFVLGSLRFGDGISIFVLGVLMAIVLFSPNVHEIVARFKPNWKWAAAISLLFVISLLAMSGQVSEFLYFQF